MTLGSNTSINLLYRVVALSTEIWASAAKTLRLGSLDPAQNTYCEISSCSNTEDFHTLCQTIMMKQMVRLNFHTLNGSGLCCWTYSGSYFEMKRAHEKLEIKTRSLVVT